LEPTIRIAEASDLKTIHLIEVGIYTDPWPRSIFYLMHGRAPDLFLVAEIEGTVIAYTIGEIDRRTGIKVGHVLNIAVAETWRRKGIANRLLNELEKRFMELGAKFAYLEVRITNKTAQLLYKNRGYTCYCVLPNYYRDEDGLSLEKPFT
jgi:ribosomal-protein-alanine N-acetyltransferase